MNNQQIKKRMGSLVEIAFLLLIVVIFVIANRIINRINQKIEKEGYMCSVDKLEYDELTGELSVTGWIIKKEVPCTSRVQESGLKMILAKNGKMKELIEIPLQSYARPDVDELYGKDEIDYLFSGYMGRINTSDEILNNEYRVLFQYNSSEEKYYYTSVYLDKGELKR